MFIREALDYTISLLGVPGPSIWRWRGLVIHVAGILMNFFAHVYQVCARICYRIDTSIKIQCSWDIGAGLVCPY